MLVSKGSSLSWSSSLWSSPICSRGANALIRVVSRFSEVSVGN